MKLDECIDKACCFYASDWHLTVMLLPYISKKLEEKDKIYMKFENSIEDKILILLEKLKIKNEENIKSINWSNEVNEDDYCENEKIYIISGSEEYICDKNNIIEKYYRNRNDKIKIINCYEVSGQEDFKKIVGKHEYKKIINTKGELNL